MVYYHAVVVGIGHEPIYGPLHIACKVRAVKVESPLPLRSVRQLVYGVGRDFLHHGEVGLRVAQRKILTEMVVCQIQVHIVVLHHYRQGHG